MVTFESVFDTYYLLACEVYGMKGSLIVTAGIRPLCLQISSLRTPRYVVRGSRGCEFKFYLLYSVGLYLLGSTDDFH